MDELLQEPTIEQATDSQRANGVFVVPVVDNVDFAKNGKVTVRIPWGCPEVLSAPVVAPGAGSDRGMFFTPKKGDNVLVSFAGGDPRRPYVIGSVWSGNDKVPIDDPGAAEHQQVIRTAKGQEIRIDEIKDSVCIRTRAGQHVKCTKNAIELKATAGTKLILNSDGTVVLTADKSIKLEAPSIEIAAKKPAEKKTPAEPGLNLTSEGATKLHGGPTCEITANMVMIN